MTSPILLPSTSQIAVRDDIMIQGHAAKRSVRVSVLGNRALSILADVQIPNPSSTDFGISVALLSGASLAENVVAAVGTTMDAVFLYDITTDLTTTMEARFRAVLRTDATDQVEVGRFLSASDNLLVVSGITPASGTRSIYIYTIAKENVTLSAVFVNSGTATYLNIALSGSTLAVGENIYDVQPTPAKPNELTVRYLAKIRSRGAKTRGLYSASSARSRVTVSGDLIASCSSAGDRPYYQWCFLSRRVGDAVHYVSIIQVDIPNRSYFRFGGSVALNAKRGLLAIGAPEAVPPRIYVFNMRGIVSNTGLYPAPSAIIFSTALPIGIYNNGLMLARNGASVLAYQLTGGECNCEDDEIYVAKTDSCQPITPCRENLEPAYAASLTRDQVCQGASTSLVRSVQRRQTEYYLQECLLVMAEPSLGLALQSPAVLVAPSPAQRGFDVRVVPPVSQPFTISPEVQGKSGRRWGGHKTHRQVREKEAQSH